MKQNYNRIWALILAGVLTVANGFPVAAASPATSGLPDAQLTSEQPDAQLTSGQPDAQLTSEQSDAQLTSEQLDAQLEDSLDHFTAETENASESSGLQTETTSDDASGDLPENSSEASDEGTTETEILPGFLYSELSADGSRQQVIIKLETPCTLDAAVLVTEEAGHREETAASQIIENYAAFSLSVSEDRKFVEIIHTIDGATDTSSLASLENGVTLDDQDFQQASLQTEAGEDGSLELTPQEEALVEESVITIDLDETLSAEDIADSVTKPAAIAGSGLAISAAGSGFAIGAAGARTADANVQDTPEKERKKVIVLDPGHGSPGTGTGRDWGSFYIDEATINFKITTYTKQALEENYANIAVYTTRIKQNECPELKDRVRYAVDKNADILVSQHINATGEDITSAHGVLAMVPNVDSSYHRESAEESCKMARAILDELVALGFNDMGFQTRMSETNTKYPDGSAADYYAIVKTCREYELPGVIIEHGFANNREDALKLSNEAMLKKIGEADARGIANYLELSEGSSPSPSDNTGVAGHTFGSKKTGWVQEDGKWYYYDSNGKKTTGWQLVKGTWYYMDSDGVMLTGWQTIKGKKYFLHPSGAMAIGWLNLNGTWYYLDSSGAMVTGWIKLKNIWYYLDPATGKMATGWVDVKGKRYYLDSDGGMLTGWQKLNNQWYYLDEEGVMLTDWLCLGSQWYYLDPATGAMLTGWQTVKGSRYYLDGDGVMLTGWIKLGNKWYYLNASGAMLTGWIKLNNTWYYLNPSDGSMAVGWAAIEGKWYYLSASGAMLTGWINLNGNWYYLNPDGSMAADTWIGSYYVDESGLWVENPKDPDPSSKPEQGDPDEGKTDPDKEENPDEDTKDPNEPSDAGTTDKKGEWILSGNRWWYRHTDGSYTVSGWENIDQTWYLFDDAGWMLTGWQKVKGIWYYMDASGAMRTGWQKVDGTWYFLDASGAMRTDWQKINGTWYYMDSSGAMRTGWIQLNRTWYYLNSDGAMVTGWLKLGDNTYYLKESGEMVTGTQVIDGKTYTFLPSGELVR